MSDDPRIRAVRTAAVRRLPSAGMRPVDPGSTQDIDRGYWYGYSPIVPRETRAPVDRPINIVPTAEREPESAPPFEPVWVNANCPPWVCPPFWSQPFETTFDGCLPFYESASLIGDCYTVPQDHVLIIRNISYEVFDAVQYDVFQFDFLVDGSRRFGIEDMLIAPAVANPGRRYALASHDRPMPTNLVIDRNHTLCIRGILRGPINLAGESPYFPGQPIVTGDCTMKVILQGWLANLRENIDGGPRPTDLGDLGNQVWPR